MPDEIKRLINILIGFGVAIIVLVCGIVFIGSYEISKINQTIIENNIAINKKIDAIENIDTNELARQVALLIKTPSDGIDGSNGINGTNGKDSLSTTTVIERQTIIEKELPPQNGKDAREYQLARLNDGRLVWKFNNDRDWSLVPTIDVEVDE